MAANSSKLFVYVQAIPIAITKQAKKFSDLASDSFRMSHSSKVALSSAEQFNGSRIVAIGHYSVLREALARGADQAISVPICDDPVTQAETLKAHYEESEDDQLSFLVGENLDGPFSGAALCGVLSQVCGLSFKVLSEQNSINSFARSVILVGDAGSGAPQIDIRRIGRAFSIDIAESLAVGNSSLESIPAKNPEVIRDLTPKEIASRISRKLRRFSP